MLNDEDRACLTKEITYAEIVAAPESLVSNKALGLDSFPPSFFQHYWNIIASDMVVLLTIRHFEI